MNNGKIKKLLKQRAESVQLNKEHPKQILEKVNSIKHFSADLQEEITGADIFRVQGQKSKKWGYKSIIPIFAGALSLVLVFFTIINPLIKQKQNSITVAKAEEVFSKEMFALGNLFSFQEESGVNLLSFTQNEFERVAEECAYYLLTGDAFLQNENIITTVYNNEDENFSEYQFKAVVSFTDLSGYKVEYVAYYDQKTAGAETTILGVIEIKGRFYQLSGKRIQKRKEIESELRVYFDNRKDYISVSNETEVNENEFTYEWVLGGKVVRGVSLETSTEKGLKQTEIEITENNKTQSYEFTYLNQTVECEYESGNVEEEFTVYLHDEYYLFVYSSYTVRVDK